MDSMRSLNSSLPRSSTHGRRRQTHADLLQAFKAAALSVTQLYKSAAADEEEAVRDSYSAGYRDALDDLLAFLDGDNLGLGDGEGWQVRTWATQRHQSMSTAAPAGDSECAPPEEEEKRTRSLSPVLQYKPAYQYQSAAVQTDPDAEPDDSAPKQNNDVFHFRAAATSPNRSDLDSVRVEVLPQPSRVPSQRQRHSSRTTERLPSIPWATLGHGAGSKRKLPLHEFFDVSAVTSPRESSGSGKRGRLA